MLRARHVHRQANQLLSFAQRSVSPSAASPLLLPGVSSRFPQADFLRPYPAIRLFLGATYGTRRRHHTRHPGPRLLCRRTPPLIGVGHVSQPPPPRPPRAPPPRPRTPRGPPGAPRRPPSRTRDAAPRSSRPAAPSPP